MSAIKQDIEEYITRLLSVRDELKSRQLSAQVGGGLFGSGINELRNNALAMTHKILSGDFDVSEDFTTFGGYIVSYFGPEATVSKQALFLISLPEPQREQLRSQLATLQAEAQQALLRAAAPAA